MQRKITYPILGIALFLFFWINLPKKLTENLRTLAISSFHFSSPTVQAEKYAQLQIENQKLKSQLNQAYEWLLFDRHIESQVLAVKEMEHQPFLKRRAKHLRTILKEEISSLPARVIYRDPSSWSSTLWVNVGEANNRALKKSVIAKNSPVLAEGSLVGVIEHVGEKQSRVRLITDSGLCPSVRVIRGASQNRELARQLEMLLNKIEKREDLFSSIFEKDHYVSSLTDLKKKIGIDWDDGYLAKGEVHGSSASLWRSRSPILKGIGFNYEYADEEGPARKLNGDVPILRVGDLLITTGLDGVFPQGLTVGSVIRTSPLVQGSYSYEIDVRPTANNLNDLEMLFILPPIE